MRVNEQGRSMIEMLGVLAIVGVLSVGGIAGYSKAMNKFKTNKAIDQINMVATNVRTLYSSQRTYDGLNNKLAKTVGLIPSEMYDNASDSTITNAFSGSFKIKPAGNNTDGDKAAFTIAIDNVPETSCISIITTEWGSDSGSGLVAMRVDSSNSASVDDTNLDAATITGTAATCTTSPCSKTVSQMPFSVIEASLACGDNTVIVWKYL